MARPRRTKGQRRRDLVFVSELYLRGETQAEIARQVSERFYPGEKPLTQQQIHYDIQVLHKEWLAAQLLNVDEAKARELARVDKIEREAWTAWERSQEEAQTVTIKTRRGGTGQAPTVERHDKVEGRVGDPSFLRTVQWCVEQRCKILGLARENVDVTSDGKPLVNQFAVVEVVKDYGQDGQQAD